MLHCYNVVHDISTYICAKTPHYSCASMCGRTRAMPFNFPPMKGTGISRLIPNCPAPALSLLYQMLAYDPDERISAETALRHTYFREIRWNVLRKESELDDKNPLCCRTSKYKQNHVECAIIKACLMPWIQDDREEIRDFSFPFWNSGCSGKQINAAIAWENLAAEQLW